MFYNAEMLGKRGPLARVWMASHLSAKISKTNLLSTSIPASVTSILGEKLLPMALRLSGQLLLGVTRIYSRKAKYLLEDCNETLGRVKRAFRPGVVDMVEGEGKGREAITMRAEVGGLEEMNYDAGLNYDWAMENVAGPSKARNPKANVSTNAEISLPDNSFAGYSQFGFGEETGIGSQDMMEGDFDEGFELGILDEDEMLMDLLPGGDDYDVNDPKGKKRARTEEGSDDEPVEAGRDAPGSVGHASARGSIGGGFDGKADEFDADGDITLQSGFGGGFDLGEGNIGRPPVAEDFGGMEEGDYGFDMQDFGGGDEEIRHKTPQPGSGDIEDDSLALTPKTAADLNKLQTKAVRKVKALKKQVVDSVTELEWESGARAAQKENLFIEPQYLPNSRLHLYLLELANSNEPSPLLPKANDPKGKSFNLAPPGLAPELHSLYNFPSRRARIEADAGRKRAVSVDSIELGRRAQSEMAEPMDMGGFEFDVYGDQEFGGGDEELAGNETVSAGGFQFDVDEGLPTPQGKPRLSQANKKQKVSNEGGMERFSTPGYLEEETFDFNQTESMGPLAVFDEISSGLNLPGSVMGSVARSNIASGTIKESLGETEEDDILGNGVEVTKWSKNTQKAIDVLSTEFLKDEEVVFEKVAEKASKRAAASFFFELLVLSTRDCIKITQEDSFGSITVASQPKFQELER